MEVKRGLFKSGSRIWAAVDPGKKGAIVFIDEFGDIEIHTMPTIGNKEKDYDLQELRNVLLKYAPSIVHFIIEDVHSIYGSSAAGNFDFGMGVGMIRMGTAMAQIPFTLVQPKAWQKKMFEGVGDIKKPGKKETGRGSLDTKAMALIAVQRLYPKLDLRKSSRSEKPHDGIVDALLMANYCKQTFN